MQTIKGVVSDHSNVMTEYDNIRQWASENKLRLNLTKTKAIIFRKRSPQPVPSFPFDVVTETKILGVTWSSDLSWFLHFRSQTSRCAKRLYILRVLKSTVSHNDLWFIYDHLIQSVLLYCSPLFGPLSFKIRQLLDKLFRRARRIICGEMCASRSCVRSHNDFYSKYFSTFPKLLKAASCSKHPLFSIVPSFRGRRSVKVPFSNTNRRRNCFTVFLCDSL